ncbi:MAG: substrate-binding domain-containing protein, partial [Rhodoplanes sp.]
MTLAQTARMIAAAVALSIAPPVAASWAQSGATAAPVSLNGAGATFPAPLYKKWIAVYQAAHRNVSIAYDVVGSGEGVKRFIAETVDFAGSDEVLADSEAAKVEAGAATVPVTAGTIVLAYNIPGVSSE